jgi:energy-coupling factor transporter ATP-binding protein EcfA2
MANYDFSTLNDRDLEELARDILSTKLGLDFQSFKPGPDKGIDLRYATINDENEIIVQVKHLIGSGVIALKSILKTEELPKVIVLNPKRYIVVTSLPLSPQDKESIKNTFSPYILSTRDILGKNDLNNFLRNNPNTEEQHFKLWLSSSNIFKRILKNGVKARSEFHADKIKKQIKLFVPNKAHSNAVKILNTNNFILITGAPGIGKSTLANMLTYQLLAKDFELIYIREITEAEDLIITGRKQVFYFDDFLGSITLDLKSSRNADSAIINFIDMIKNDSQKKLILTCRTTLLNQAKQTSEKINDSKIDIAKHEVHVKDYRNIDKAKILYNHIYISQLSIEQKSIFFKDMFYWQVIKHKSYNPRVIEYFTDSDRIESDKPYGATVIDFLNNPSLIWEKPFTKQISISARLLLTSLYSLGSRFVLFENRLQEAFSARLDYEVRNNNFIKQGDDYAAVIKETVGMFINRIHKDKNRVEYSFFNPSIEDFLYDYFTRNKDEYLTHLRSAISYEQFKGRITTTYIKNSKQILFSEKKLQAQLLEIFISKAPHLSGYGDNDLNFIVILIRLFAWDSIDSIVQDRINSLNLSTLGWTDRENLIEILNYMAEHDLTNCIDQLDNLILILSKNMESHHHIESFSKLISKYTIYSDVIENSKSSSNEYYDQIKVNIEESWSKNIDQYIRQSYNLSSITTKEELIQVVTKRKEEANNIIRAINISSSFAVDNYEFNYEQQLDNNRSAKSSEKITIDNFQESHDPINEIIEVNRLFNSNDVDEWDDLPF